MLEGLSVGIVAIIFVAFIYLVFWSTVFIILYHLTRFGIGVVPKRLAAFFLLGAVLLFCASLILLTRIELSAINI